MMDGGPTYRVLRRTPSHDTTKSLREVIDGPFAEWLGDHQWEPWFAYMAALRGESMSRNERKIYEACTGRKEQPREPFTESWVIVGRRGRKSAIAAVLAVYHAV